MTRRVSRPTGSAPGLPRRKAYDPPSYVKADVHAIQAVADGRASPEEQKRAIHFIVYDLCAAYDWPYRPESARDTDVALGRQFVGQQIVFFMNLNAAVLFKGSKDSGSEQGR